MSRRSIILLVTSVLAAGVLMGVLLAAIDVHAIIALLSRGAPVPFAVLVILTGVLAALAGEKWRVIDSRLHREKDDALPMGFHFVLTAVGVAVGQVVPVQVGTALSRTAGSYFFGGRAMVRGAGATVFEQFFDLLAAAFLAVASTVVLVTGGGASLWLGLVALMAVIGLSLTTVAVRILTRMAYWLNATPMFSDRPGVKLLERVAGSVLFAPAVARRLFLLSLLRFAVLWAMAEATSETVGIDIPIWQLGCMMPFMILSNLIAITPGAIGVNEWSAVSILILFGTPFSLAAQWAVVNRILVASAAFIVGITATLVGLALHRSRVLRT